MREKIGGIFSGFRLCFVVSLTRFESQVLFPGGRCRQAILHILRKGGSDMDIKKIIGPIVFITMITSGISFARTYDLEVNASHSALEARFDTTLTLERGLLTTGIGAIYSDDDYKIGSVKLAMGNGRVLPGLRFSLGFKGVLGDMERGGREGNLVAVSFLLLGKYSIPETISPIPVDVSAGLSWAPDSLCFSDSNRYLDFRTSLDFRIVKSAAIILGYRYIKVRLDDDTGDWEMSDDSLFVGCQLWF
jgi:hypothetical protein